MASKLLEYHPLEIKRFQQFALSDLILFEQHFMRTLQCNISPLTTPTHFAQFFLCHWPAIDVQPDVLLTVVEKLIGKLWEDPESMQYDASAIALSALMMGFNECNSVCTTMPSMFCAQSLEEDVDGCLGIFRRIQVAEGGGVGHGSSSPTGVDGVVDVIAVGVFAVDEQAAISDLNVNAVKKQKLV